MIKTILERFLFFIFGWTSISTSWSASIPSSHHHASEQSLNLRIFKTLRSSIEIFSEWNQSAREHQDDFQQRALGLRWQAFPGLKLGAIWKRTYGERHNEDWIKQGNTWVWAQTKRRGENHIILEASPRHALELGSWGQCLFENRIRWSHNFYNSRSHLIIRPGAGLFWAPRGELELITNFRYEWTLALNSGIENIPEKWVYIDILRPLSPELYLGPFFSQGERVWNSPGHFTSATGQTYRVKDENIQIWGLNMAFYL